MTGGTLTISFPYVSEWSFPKHEAQHPARMPAIAFEKTSCMPIRAFFWQRHRAIIWIIFNVLTSLRKETSAMMCLKTCIRKRMRFAKTKRLSVIANVKHCTQAFACPFQKYLHKLTNPTLYRAPIYPEGESLNGLNRLNRLNCLNSSPPGPIYHEGESLNTSPPGPIYPPTF